MKYKIIRCEECGNSISFNIPEGKGTLFIADSIQVNWISYKEHEITVCIKGDMKKYDVRHNVDYDHWLLKRPIKPNYIK